MCIPNGESGRAVLPLERFLRFFEQIRPYAEHLTLIGGEPLMYPWIDQVLELLAQHEIAVTMNTNATLLREKVLDRLLALHALHLKCSLDAATRETYRRIRGSDLFERVSANVRGFAERARELPHMHFIPVFVVMRENLDEVLPFVDLAAPLRPSRIEFHPVRHVQDWRVTNGTGWVFDGSAQSCEFFKDEYNDVMRRAALSCAAKGIACETHLL
jgi:MoaA/NifB/PqqE/SkfB family radical SAM enzyme